MLQQYWERARLISADWRQRLAAMGVGESQVSTVVAEVVASRGEATVSVYRFSRLAGEPGFLAVCHDLGRGAISFGTEVHWGQWDDAYEVLTVDGSGEKFNFDGQPAGEGDDGACSLGNM